MSVYMLHNNDNKNPHYRSDMFHCLSLSLSASISSYKSLSHTHMQSLTNFHKTNLLQCHIKLALHSLYRYIILIEINKEINNDLLPEAQYEAQ